METLLSARFADLLSRSWKFLLMRGIAAIAFGVLTWMRPGLSILALMFVFGIYALVDGVIAAWTGLRGRKTNEHWSVLLFVGLAGVFVGVTTLMMPLHTAWVLLLLIAVWAIVRGVFEITAGVYARKEIEGEWVLIFAGVVSVLFGAVMLSHPVSGGVVMLSIIAAYAVVVGVLLVMLAFRVRNIAKHPPHPAI